MRPARLLYAVALLAAATAAVGAVALADVVSVSRDAALAAVVAVAGVLLVAAAWSARLLTRSANDHAAECERLSVADPLTGLATRAAFDEALAVQVARGERDGERGVLIVLDIDHLPASGAGGVIRSIGQTLGGRLRRTDVGARIDRDQFAVIAPHTDVAGGITLGFALIDAVRALDTTVSAGLATLDRADVHESADAAMQLAKRAGGDRLVVAQEPAHA